jgi:hypothetical protein
MPSWPAQEQRRRCIPTLKKVAVACTFPFPLHSNHLHEVTGFWDVTSVCTSQVSNQASHRNGNLHKWHCDERRIISGCSADCRLLQKCRPLSDPQSTQHFFFPPKAGYFALVAPVTASRRAVAATLPTRISFSLNLGFEYSLSSSLVLH